MLCMTDVYLRDITDTYFPVLYLNVSRLSVCSSCCVRWICYIIFIIKQQQQTNLLIYLVSALTTDPSFVLLTVFDGNNNDEDDVTDLHGTSKNPYWSNMPNALKTTIKKTKTKQKPSGAERKESECQSWDLQEFLCLRRGGSSGPFWRSSYRIAMREADD